MKTNLKLFLILIMLISIDSFAQSDSLKIQKMQELETVFKDKIKTNLNLDDSSAEKLINVTKDNKNKLRAINKEKKEIYKTIESDPDATDIDSKLNKIIELERKSIDQKENYFNELKTFMTPQQIAKSITMKRKFNKELRKEINKRGRKNKRNRN